VPLETETLALCVLVAQRKRNEALGVNNDTQFLRGLAQFIQSQNQVTVGEVVKVTEGLYLQALIEEYQKLAKQVTEYITENIEDQETRTEGIRAMMGIEAHVNYLGKRLEGLWP
jgi:hypothetical protein